MARNDTGLGPTRIRDLVIVAAVAGVGAYLLTRFNYGSIPRLPRFAGVSAGLLGIGEAIAGWGLRSRIRPRHVDRDASSRPPGPPGPPRPPVPPLVAARALSVAKASALAAAALIGLWLGFALFVWPEAALAVAAAADAVTATIGLVGAAVLLGGALWLEYCCRAPRVDPPGGR